MVADSITGSDWNRYVFRTGRNSSQDAISNAVALGAVLPDGSPFAYTIIYRPNATGWVVHMSGGGWAFLKNGTAAGGGGQGAARLAKDGLVPPSSSSSLGSCYGICDGIMSNDVAANPDFASWNKVLTY